MSKLELTDISSGYLAPVTVNANNALIETALENTLSRDGTTPNQMEAQLDMNSNRIINLPEPVDPSDAARLADVDAAIATGLPDQAGHAGTVLSTDGTTASWEEINNDIWSGTDLSIANGGTGASTAADARTNLELGALATASTINDSNWSGTDLAVANGGTGASTATDARTNLGLGTAAVANVGDFDAAGTAAAAVAAHVAAGDPHPTYTTAAELATALASYQPLDSDLTTLAANITAAGHALVDDATAGDQRNTLGLGTIATQNANNVTISGGSVTGITDLAVADGGTGGSTPQAARQNLGLQDDCIEFIIDGVGTTITTGVKGDLEVPYDCTATAWTLLADQSGSIVIDIWKDVYANFPPTNVDAIPGGGNEPSISTNTNAQDTDIANWTTTGLTKGDILRFNVDSCTSITRCTLVLRVTR